MSFRDAAHRPVKRGDRVTVEGCYATVLNTSDPDHDVDEGRMIYFAPSMTVVFDIDGSEERLLCEIAEDGGYDCVDAHLLIASPLLDIAVGLARAEFGVQA